jgi:hypothetical protein
VQSFLSGFTSPIAFEGSASANLTKRVVQGNSGVADYRADPATITTLPTAPIATTLTGTAGSAACSQSLQGRLKTATCYLNAYQETGSAQTYNYPVAFSTYPTLLERGAGANSCGAYNPSTTASGLTLPSNAGMSAETCAITAIGQ